MFSKSWLAAFAASFVCAGAAHAAPPLEAYGRLPTLSDVTLSPDGKMVAFVKGDETKRLLVIQPLGTQQPSMILNIGDAKLRELQWADNTHLLITESTTTLPPGLIGKRTEWYMAEVFDVEKQSQQGLIGHVYRPGGGGPNGEVEAMNVVAGPPQPRVIDGHTFVFVPDSSIHMRTWFGAASKPRLMTPRTWTWFPGRKTGTRWWCKSSARVTATATFSSI
jgi:hypothetical protein